MSGQRIKRVNRLKHRIYEERVRALALFRWKKRRLRMVVGYQITVSSYLKEGYEEDEVRLFLEMYNEMLTNNG